MKKSTFYIVVIVIIATISLTASGVFSQTRQSNGKLYDLDALDRIKTTNTARLDGKMYTVYQSKNGRLYFETGKLTKTGKPQRKYLTKSVSKKDTL